jgi:SNF2 family DNA or RNA helicase
MKIIDNKKITLLEVLEEKVDETINLYYSGDFFSCYAIFETLHILNKSKSVKILLRDSSFETSHELLQTLEEEYLNLQLDRKYKVDKVINFIENVVDIRKGSLGNQNLLILENDHTVTSFILTPLNFDTVCLGTTKSLHPVLINEIDDSNSEYLKYFKEIWDKSQVVKTEVLKSLNDKNGYQKPSVVYKSILKETFGLNDINHRIDTKLNKIGFKDSVVWNLLYNFQKDAVVGAINKIETYGGCIIADSVGLGKTFEALAVMKYYQLRNDRILVLAPKKLKENWSIYQLNDKRNILSKDRFNYDILNHTDLSRNTGYSGDINLSTINWGNYDLVVIDESHNFRNNPNRKDRVTRYSRLMDDVIRSNIKTKVLMLSATPVNNKLSDLKNQISFITEGNDESFQGYGIESISNVLNDTQRKFNRWFSEYDPDDINVNELLEDLGGSYFKILDMITIARSRKHIEKYYDTTEIGKFPNRLKPITVSPPIDTQNQMSNIGDIYDTIGNLTLSSYTPLAYVRSDKKDEYAKKYDIVTSKGTIFRQTDREQSLIYLMRVNLLKRLESSVDSFRITVGKLIKSINHNLEQINNHNDEEVDYDLSITEVNIDDTDFEDFLVGGKTKVLIQDIDLIRWNQDLEFDINILKNLHEELSQITVQRDAKLEKLKSLIEDKLQNPINPDNKKVIVFTAFADTASYLHENIEDWLYSKHGLYSSLITGSGTNKTNLPMCKTDLSSLLINFSPKSKKREQVFPDQRDEIDVMICTDCISEGQNLQDCDYLINYDIHWNPVRIIQRFGRIDRIGSVNDNIQLVNFFPNIELDNFIDLVARVKGRMVMLDVSATGEDNVISKDPSNMKDLEYRKKQLKQLQNEVIDIEDVQGNISISDLTFNDFKIDLEKTSREELKTIEKLPQSSFSVVQSNSDHIQKGVIFCFKDKSGEKSDNYGSNVLYPYFLIYKSLNGSQNIKSSQPKITLDYLRKLCVNEDELNPRVIEKFEDRTSNLRKMDEYQSLLKESISEVRGVQEEIGLDSLATSGGTLFSDNEDFGNENIQLVNYLIIE